MLRCCSAPAHFLYYLEKLQALPARGYIHLDLLELIKPEFIRAKGLLGKEETPIFILIQCVLIGLAFGVAVRPLVIDVLR